MKSESRSALENLDLIGNFTEGVRSFLEREARIDYAERLHESRQRQSVEEQRESLQREAEEHIAGAEAAAADATEFVKEVAAHRRKRIDQAQINVRNRLVQDLQLREGQHKSALQRRMMDAGRQREADLAAAEAHHTEQVAAIAGEDARFEKLEAAALRALRGFGGTRAKLRTRLESATPSDTSDLESLGGLYSAAGKGVQSFRRNPLSAWFGGFPVWIQLPLLAAAGVGAVPAAGALGLGPLEWIPVLAVTGGALAFVFLLYAVGQTQATSFAKKTGAKLVRARRQRLSVHAAADSEKQERIEAIEEEHRNAREEFERGLKQKTAAGAESRYGSPDAVEERARTLRQRLDAVTSGRLRSIEETARSAAAEANRERDEALARLEAGNSSPEPAHDFAGQRANVAAEWREQILPREEALHRENEAAAREPSWSSHSPADWTPPERLRDDLAFGTLSFSLADAGVEARDESTLALTGEGAFTVPLRLGLPECGSILIETRESGRAEAIATLNYLVLGLLAGSPPGRLSFSLFDPVGLGESFAGLMHLADYEEILVNTRIRTQSDQIERRLGELCDHMEKVIQMYLRNEYRTISEYNATAGSIAERYHFVVVADFPKQFSDEAGRRLLSIAASGARCGVFLLMHHDLRGDLPSGFEIDDLRSACLCFRAQSSGVTPLDPPVEGAEVSLFPPPGNDRLIDWVHRIGEANRDSNRVEVPFSTITPGPSEFWSVDTSQELRVPIGRTGATKLQYLAIGKGTCQHALIAGKTGSGKSTLFHVIITNLALWCDPDQVEFYLIDFKKGVEFKDYADSRLPHARVIAIESDREFGLSVLQRLDEELKERGEKFRALGVQDVAGYAGTEAAGPMPRTLLLIDEFQEFFVEDDQIAQQAAVLLDRIVRQGRAFGIHAILGSQTLGGAFTLARATLGQMVIRIALQCNEADAYLIMDDTNPAPRMLTRPGEGIYNDSAGAVEANSPFQVVWMDEGERTGCLETIAAEARKRGLDDKPQVVFEGNAPAQVDSDKEVARALAGAPEPGSPRFFVGAPNAIKGPTEIVFPRQSGSNLMVVGQRDDVVEAMTAVAIRILRARLGDTCRLIVIDSTVADPNGKSWLKDTLPRIGNDIEVPGSHEIGDTINALAAELREATDSGTPPERSTVVFLLGLQRFKKLRYEEDFSFSLESDGGETKPANSLDELIREGPALGFHTVVSIDTWNSINRCLNRKAISEFEMKILFQMSAADSASLIESGKASDLGMNRALFYNEPTGAIEVFRPFAQPAAEWFR